MLYDEQRMAYIKQPIIPKEQHLMKKLTFDIMVGKKFYRTMHMPITMDMVIDYQGEQPIINGEKIKEWVLQKCPTLKYNNFTICF